MIYADEEYVLSVGVGYAEYVLDGILDLLIIYHTYFHRTTLLSYIGPTPPVYDGSWKPYERRPP